MEAAMSETDNERTGELAEELRLTRIELTKTCAAMEALTKALERKSPKVEQHLPPRPPEQEPHSPTEYWDGGGSIMDDFRQLKKFLARLWRRKPTPEHEASPTYTPSPGCRPLPKRPNSGGPFGMDYGC